MRVSVAALANASRPREGEPDMCNGAFAGALGGINLAIHCGLKAPQQDGASPENRGDTR